MDAATALVGLVVGIVVGLTSMGGGALLTPALVLFLGVPPSVAVGSDVLIAAVMKLFGGGAYALRGEVHWQTVRRLAAGSVPGAALGVLVLNQLPTEAIDLVVGRGLGVAMLLATICTVWRLVRGSAPDALSWPSARFTAMLGFGTGLLVSMTSVGSGSLLIAVLFFFFPLRTQTMVGTDLVHALALSTVATLGHGLSGRVDVALAVSVLVGAIPGVLLGSRVASLVPERVLRTGLAVILAVVGLRMLMGATPRALHPVAPAAAVEVQR